MNMETELQPYDPCFCRWDLRYCNVCHLSSFSFFYSGILTHNLVRRHNCKLVAVFEFVVYFVFASLTFARTRLMPYVAVLTCPGILGSYRSYVIVFNSLSLSLYTHNELVCQGRIQ